MDFGLSQDQQMLRDAVARCLADTCPLDHVRECAERDNPLSDKVLRAVQDLGIPGMLVPEEHGGLGMTLLDAAIVAEQLAYAVAPVPFLASHVLAPIALSEAGSEEQKAQWLPKIASGAVLPTAVFTEPDVAVIVELPSATAVTRPADDTVAASPDAVHVTVAPPIVLSFASFTVGTSVVVSPNDAKLRLVGASVTLDAT